MQKKAEMQEKNRKCTFDFKINANFFFKLQKYICKKKQKILFQKIDAKKAEMQKKMQKKAGVFAHSF